MFSQADKEDNSKLRKVYIKLFVDLQYYFRVFYRLFVECV